MPITLFYQHPELTSMPQYFQTFNRETLTSSAYLTASLHTPLNRNSHHATPCNHPSETIHQLWKPDLPPHITPKSKPLYFSTTELQISIYEKQATFSSFPKENPFTIPYHWAYHKFCSPFFSEICDEQLFSTFIYF